MQIRSLVAVFLSPLLLAQVETSTSIRGLITDPTGAAVPGARVNIRNVATGEERSTLSDSSGFYSFPSVVPGTYDILVSQVGFKRAEVRNRVAQVTQPAQVDVVLQVGETTESVTVSAAGAELLSTTSAEVAGTIVNRLVTELPLNGRNFFDLAVTLPHVSLQSLSPQSSFAAFSANAVFGANQTSPIFRQSGIFAAGNRDSATNVSLDGVNIQSSVYRQATPQTPPSAIQEVKIHVSGMNAEFGNGVAAVNVITKGGPTNSMASCITSCAMKRPTPITFSTILPDAGETLSGRISMARRWVDRWFAIRFSSLAPTRRSVCASPASRL
ncbi:MAG: carboxypeptidase-like regulatory domain-containing protein [Bryobacteraceae bacterium]|nr:carboxypeptidase-like regulatory domain-containing protein [Bryobacteraceae bacterium]MDW8377378.1 carboxypeptidase-like regulatory domain-containing protein [Bryobacterales bacterium]